MVGEAFVVPHITLKLRLCVLSFGFFTSKARIFLFILVQVAFVISSSCWSVTFPITHANPTEFIATLRARHMVTSLIFLDTSLTFRTTFRVCCNPGHIFRLSIRFFSPHSCCFAVARLVREISTHETENGSAFACDIIDHTTLVFSLTAVITLYIWTPLDVLIFIREGFAKPLPINFFITWWLSQKVFKYSVANFHIASRLHASGVNACISTSDFRLEIISPTLTTESVLTGQRIRIWWGQ